MAVVERFAVPARGVGLPDYSAPQPLGAVPVGPTYTLTNMAELAVRLGSINTFDRRGDVVWFDDFESGAINKWENLVHISPGAVTPSAVMARNGAFSAMFTGAGVAPTGTGIYHYERFPVLGLVGFEASFTLQIGLDRVEFLSDFFDGADSRFFGVRYNQATQTLEYVDRLGAWVPLATGLDIFGYISLFHTIKFVVDLRSNQYVRCLLDNRSYPMANIAGQVVVGAPAVPCWRILAASLSDTVTGVVNYMDDIILTQNEPERSI